MPPLTASREPDWEWYRSFLAVLEHGSLSAAARSLGLTQPTVGRHIDSLEQALRLPLFTRSPEGFAATEAAQELGPYAASIAASAAALRRAASSHGSTVRGTVRVTASEVVGVEVLPPLLAELRERHPELVIELVLSNRVENLLQRESDIAVRMFRPTQDALIARHVGTIELGLHAHQRYLERHGTPRSVSDLQHHALIGFDRETAFIRQMQPRLKGFTREQFALRADSDLAQIAATRAGLGIGVMHAPLAAQNTQLSRVLPRQFAVPLDTWIVMHHDLRDSPRCAVTFAALAEGLSGYIGGTSQPST